MNNGDIIILQLINKNISMKEIADKLNISEKQLYIKIKKLINYGYKIEAQYSYDGNICYQLNNTEEQKFEIKMNSDRIHLNV